MEKINGNDNKQLIEAAKERLRWYTLEASEEEYDAEEVEALVQLLKCMEPVETQTDDEALERFHAYVQMREAEEGVTLTELSVKQKRNTGLAVFIKTHKFIAAAAAILLVVMIAGGSFGAVNAGKGNGFFYWLRKDDEGMTMITSPENMDNESKDMENAKEYKSEEEVPEEYRKYLIDVEGIEALEGYELKYIRVTRLEEYYVVRRCFADKVEEKKLIIGVFVYPEKTSLYRETYMSAELDNPVGDTHIMIKEKTEGDNEYTIYFYKDNVKYYVEGNVDIAVLEAIAIEYENIIF